MTFTEAKSALEFGDKDDLRSALAEHDEEIILAAIECGVPFSDIGEAYHGEWGSDEEFVQNLCEDIGEIPRDLPAYIHIDWAATSRDIMMDYSAHNGHYFRNL